MEVEKKQQQNYRKNQEIQKYLKDQMMHVQDQRDFNLHKKGLDAQHIKQKTTEFKEAMKRKKFAIRSEIKNTQNHNKIAFYDREDEKRANIDLDRIN